MPLRDHFRPPLDDLASWEELHGGWPMEIVRSLFRLLPPGYVAAPRVHHGAFVEVDVATFERGEPTERWTAESGGDTATAVWAPPQPTRAVETDLPDTDEYEVRVIHRTVCSRRSQPSPAPSKWPKIQSPYSERTVNSAPSLSG